MVKCCYGRKFIYFNAFTDTFNHRGFSYRQIKK